MEDEEKTRVEVAWEEPRRVVEVSGETVDNTESINDSEQNWTFLIPFAVPILIVGVIVFAFVSFGRKGEQGPLSGVDLNPSSQPIPSGKVEGTRSAAGPKVPPSPKPSPSLKAKPSLSPSSSLTPNNSNNNPESSPSPTPSPSPSTDPTPSPDSTPSPSEEPLPTPQ